MSFAKSRKDGAPPPTYSDNLKSVVGRLYEAILAQDLGALELLLSPNFTYRTLDGHMSRTEYLAMQKASLSGAEAWNIECISMTAEEDRVTDEVEISFRMDGKQFVGRFCSVCIFDDDLLYEMRSYGGVVPESELSGNQPSWSRA